MARSKSRKGKAVEVPSEQGSESEENAQNTQEGGVDVLKSAHNMFKKNKERREAKRVAIEGDHKQRVKTARAKIGTLFQAKRSRVTKSQSALWYRLDALNRRRQDLESRILASMKIIETQTGNLSSEVIATFIGRIEDIEDLSSQEDEH